MYADKRWDGPVGLAHKSQARQALLDAAGYIEKWGWCQGREQSGDAVCAVGALRRVAPRHIAHIAGGLLADAVGAYLASRWNDMAGRTKEQVINAMRTAANDQ